MNFEPIPAGCSDLLGNRVLEETTRDVSAHVVEMRRDGINSASEVDIVREIDLLHISKRL